jgi:glycogen(starch) synthase
MTLPRIALVGDYPPPHGGVSVHVAALERALRGRGVDARVLDIGKGRHEGPSVVPAGTPLRYAAALARAAAERRVVHAHTSGANPKSWMVAASAGRARLPGAPRAVLTLHSGLGPSWLAERRARRAAARLACAPYGRVVAVNAEIAEALASCGVRRERVVVIPAFLGAALAPGEPPARFAALRAAHAPVFCAAVAPGATYGEDVLVAAFEDVRAAEPRAALALFGPGSERGAGAALGPDRGVLALGEIDHAAALGVIGACDVFVRPTRADGDALSVREALSLGRAVVASGVGYRPPGCALVRAGDAADLARGMLAASRQPARAGALAASPAQDAFEQLLAVYRAVAEEGRTLPSDSAHMEETPSCHP